MKTSILSLMAALCMLVVVCGVDRGYAQATPATTTTANPAAMPSPDSFENATKTKMTPVTNSDLMSQGESCMQYDWHPVPALQNICCYLAHDKDEKHNCVLGKMGSAYDIKYWEPSEVIEVSCRSGFSMLKPGLSGRGSKAPQSCVGFNKPGNSRWFFEARVWAINGYDGGLRHQAMGSVNGERMRQCTEAKGDDTDKGNVWGYGQKKWGFSRGGASGPAGSWEAYISDNDPSWATDVGGTSTIPSQSACKAGAVDLENCWGTVNPTGWVNHTNPRVAAALVAWRAHTKALGMNKVSKPASGGYKMAMDYPFITYSGAYGQSMGAPGGSKTGSKCFQPGDAGPEWYGGKTAEQIPGMLKGMNPGQLTSVAEVNPGIYIFTIWVSTSCRRWTVDTPGPGGICKYEDKS